MQDEVAPQSYNVDSGGHTIRWKQWDLICLPDAETAATSEDPSKQTDVEPGEQAQTNNLNDTNDLKDSNDSTD